MYNADPNRPAGPLPGGQDTPYYSPVVPPSPPGPPAPFVPPAGTQPYGVPPAYAQPPVQTAYPAVPGNPMPYYVPMPYPPANAGQVKAVASLVLGIIGLVLCHTFFFSLPCQIIGLILGILAKRQRAGGMATAGIVLSCVGLALSMLLFVLILSLILDSQSPPSTWMYDVPYDACLRRICLAAGL